MTAKVYHGSPEGDLDHIESSSPPYKGSIGSGVYVTYDPEVARFYGPHVYELEILLHEDDVFWLTPDTMQQVEGFEGHSVLVGEQVPPFSFDLKGQRYTVGWDDDMADSIAGQMARDRLVPIVGEKAADKLTDKGSRVPDSYDADEWSMQFEEDEFDKTLLDKIADAVDGIDEKVEKQFGLIIDLEDIGNEVELAGYKAVYLEGARSMPDSELLVFNEDDLRMVGEMGPW